jgi:hypothetical protein
MLSIGQHRHNTIGTDYRPVPGLLTIDEEHSTRFKLILGLASGPQSTCDSLFHPHACIRAIA